MIDLDFKVLRIKVDKEARKDFHIWDVREKEQLP